MNIFGQRLSAGRSRSIALAQSLIGLMLLGLLFAACDRPSSSTELPPEQVATLTAAQAPATSSIPGCTSPAALTPSQTEGPYFKAGSPERASLIEATSTGTKLVLTGTVVTKDCKPIAHALLEFWQADAKGNYDNNGYTLRGHQYTDANGRYELTTIVPGLYPGRTEHIHVKVQAPNGPVLTSQLYFPGVTQNESDGIFDPKLVMEIQPTNAGLTATYIFVTSEK
jgi:protocatechuate 3,4-dioxygenase beta subunit